MGQSNNESEVNGMQEQAKREIEELSEQIRKLPNTSESFTYMSLLKNAQLLYIQEDYNLVCAICAAACDSLSQRN